MIVVPTEAREKAISRLRTLLENWNAKDLSHKKLQEAIGSAAYVAYFRRFRTGIEAFRSAYPWLDGDFFKFAVKSRALKANLKVNLKLLMEAASTESPIIIDARGALMAPKHVFTDANLIRMCAVFFNSPSHAKFSTKCIMLHMANPIVKKPQNIAFWEIMAVLLAIISYKNFFLNSTVIMHIDNVEVLFALVRATAIKPELRKTLVRIYEELNKLNCKIYYDFVKSELNPADIGTRLERLSEFKKIFNVEEGNLVFLNPAQFV